MPSSPRLHLALIPLAALLAVLPLLLVGPSCGHDFDFHLLSWLEAAQQIAHGGYPHWAFTPALNAGEPRFLFYPPLSWGLGAVLGLALTWKFATTAFTWVCLTLGGLTARHLASRCTGPGGANLAAVLYMVNPYMLFNAYERAAYGELLASAWLPLLFAAALAPELSVVELAMPVALLWLTNVPAAVMGCYALALLLAVRLMLPVLKERSTRTRLARARTRLALGGVGGVALGLALSAFYLLPAAFERRYVQASLATGVGMRVLDSTLFHRMTPVDSGSLIHDHILRQASTIAVGLLLAVAAMLVALMRKQRDSNTVALLAMTAAIAFLMTPLSLAVWPLIPQLIYLQFPWRMCSLLAVAAVFLLGRLLPVTLPRAGALGLALLGVAVFVPPAWSDFRQVCDDEDSIPGRVAQFHSADGTEAMDEYTPEHAENDVPPHDPPYWSYCAAGRPAPDSRAETDDVAPPPGQPEGQTPTRFSVTVPCPSLLVLNRRQYPAWRVEVNGLVVAPSTPERQDGLITVAIPAGTSHIALTFAPAPDRTAGLGISLLAGVLAAGMGLRGRQRGAA